MIKIRHATSDDSPIVNSFLTRLIRDEKKYDININEKCIVTHLYEDLILNDSNCVLIAEDGNKIVGYLYGYIENIGNAYINSICQLEAMFVDEEYRNNNIGSMLIDEFKKWCRSKGAKYIEVKVCNGNEKAIALYQKNNFVSVKSIMKIELGD